VANIPNTIISLLSHDVFSPTKERHASSGLPGCMVPDDYESDADEKSIPRPIAALDQPIPGGTDSETRLPRPNGNLLCSVAGWPQGVSSPRSFVPQGER
jgi:hypothetical protein